MSPRRTFLLAFLAYFLLAGAWALALPVNGTYDEKQHLVRAYAVWTGQFIPHARGIDATGLPADAIDGPRSLLPANADCTWHPKPPKPASCQQPVTDRSDALIPTSAGRYSPVYYLAVGLPLRLSPDGTGLIWARLLSAALNALFLAAAAMIAVRLGNRLLLAALALVTTPLAVDLNGAVNPNGLEISAGILLFVALVAALRNPGGTQYLKMAGIAAATLASVLHLGVALALFLILACFMIAGWPPVRDMLRSRTAWLWFGLPSIAGAVFAVAWLFGSGVLNITVPARPRQLSTGAILEGLVTTRAEFYARQVVAQFGYGETTVSPAMILLWYVLIAAIVVPALWLAGWRVRLALAGVFLASYAILAGLELHYAPLVNWYAHSRYIMPLGAAIVLGAAFVDRYVDRLRERGWLDRLVLALVAITVPLHLYALARVMTRFQVGIDAGLDPFGGTWRPVAGPLLPLILCFVGALLLAVMVKNPFVRPTPQLSTANTLSN